MLKLLTTLMETAPPGSVLAVEADEHFDTQLLPRPGEWDIREYPPATVAMLRLPAAETKTTEKTQRRQGAKEEKKLQPVGPLLLLPALQLCALASLL